MKVMLIASALVVASGAAHAAVPVFKATCDKTEVHADDAGKVFFGKKEAKLAVDKPPHWEASKGKLTVTVDAEAGKPIADLLCAEGERQRQEAGQPAASAPSSERGSAGGGDRRPGERDSLLAGRHPGDFAGDVDPVARPESARVGVGEAVERCRRRRAASGTRRLRSTASRSPTPRFPAAARPRHREVLGDDPEPPVGALGGEHRRLPRLGVGRHRHGRGDQAAVGRRHGRQHFGRLARSARIRSAPRHFRRIPKPPASPRRPAPPRPASPRARRRHRAWCRRTPAGPCACRGRGCRD